MGRPLKKKNFGAGTGNQLRIRANLGTEGDGFIVKQKSSRRYRVNVAGVIGVCHLVDKANGTLGLNEMTISVLTDANTVQRVTKLTSHLATVGGARVKWDFVASLTNATDQISTAATGTLAPAAITITVNPVSESIAAAISFTTTFVVTSTITAGYTMSYAWQLSTDTGVTWSTITDAGVYSGSKTNTLTVNPVTGLAGTEYRAVVSSAGLTSVTSTAATLTA